MSEQPATAASKARLKGTDAQTLSLCIFSSQLKPMAGKVGSFTLCLTSHGSAAAGRTIPPTARPSRAASASSRQPRATATSSGPTANQQTQLALASKLASVNSPEYSARTTVMAAISVVEGKPLQADRELLLRDYNANRINQEFAHALRSCRLRQSFWTWWQPSA